ncbi:glycosyl transferase [Microbacterium nanhaiense]|uniref:D-inositol 3-phosphate glycosyltransferase n=1 Tax=Microbacterium nanhaiense TaxID=1301026 RepID=A0ABQ2N332_9MICO|nr:glycosyltransferase [Microbacterium nanhaiense]GGO66267.1 glycosyl transferase [Microbacterium nanhaiense]
MIVHEWLERSGGAENVVEAMREVFPDAPLWSLWDASEGRFGAHTRETVLAKSPLKGKKALSLPLMPLVWRNLPKIDAEWMLISSHLFAHHARFGGKSSIPKLVYAHTPARYIWTPELDGRGRSKAARLAASALKPLDRRRAQEPVAIAGNSRFIAQRIADTWQRDAEVIYPPVSIEAFLQEEPLSSADQKVLESLPGEYLLGVSRFVPYKQLETAIFAGRASGLPVVLAGRGPDRERLEQIALNAHPGRVHFVDHPSFPLLKSLMHKAHALVFAAIEDFGIVPVEAMASGTPVLANAIGGASESVIDGVTGAHLHDCQSESALLEAVEKVSSVSPKACVARAKEFDISHFKVNIKRFVENSLSMVE